MVIKRALLVSIDTTNVVATIQIMEATSTQLTGVPLNRGLLTVTPATGDLCAVLFFDEQNPTDAVVLAIYPNK